MIAVLTLFFLPMGAVDATAQPLLAIEQMEAPFVAVAQTAVWQAPSEESHQIALLKKGEKLMVTGRVRGGFWYRIYSEARGIGYVIGDAIVSASAYQPAGGEENQSQPDTAPVVETATGRTTDDAGLFKSCADCPEMVSLPAGTYKMGSEAGGPTEKPVRDVAIGYRFALGRYEVTVAQWMACVTAGGCSYEPSAVSNPERTPVRNLSWDDAQEYVHWLAKTTGKPYRLPSEVEWEYAARAGTDSETGGAIRSAKAWPTAWIAAPNGTTRYRPRPAPWRPIRSAFST